MIRMFADVIFVPPALAICKTLDSGDWEYWIRSCWMYENSAAATVAVSVTLAAFVGVQLWARSKAGK